MFLASCLQTVVHKYPYNFGLFPDLLKEEKIKLPVIADGTPDWIYMGGVHENEDGKQQKPIWLICSQLYT